MKRAWAVVPSNGRPYLDDLIASLLRQVYDVIVIANHWQRPDDPAALETAGLPVCVIEDDSEERNISRWWNLGLDTVARHAGWLGDTEWDVLVVNDDVVCPPGLVETLGKRMRERGAAMAYPDQVGGREEILHTAPGPVPLGQRVTGYAFMLRGELGQRADESLAWWFGDDSADWEARTRGGSLLVPGIPVQHRAPDVQTNARPELREQTRRDRETFINRWGKAPW